MSVGEQAGMKLSAGKTGGQIEHELRVSVFAPANRRLRWEL
jgi:hypothetical protein